MLIDALKLQKRTFFQQEAVFSIVGKKRQTKGTNSESKQNRGILRYGSSLNQKLPPIQDGRMVQFYNRDDKEQQNHSCDVFLQASVSGTSSHHNHALSIT